MKQVFFHSLVVCFFLPLLGVIAFSLNSYGFPLMEQYQDKSIKFFIAFPYFLLLIAALYGSALIAERLSARWRQNSENRSTKKPRPTAGRNFWIRNG